MKNESQSPLVEPLTEREADVLALLAAGKTNREIAAELVLSVNTVKWYNRQIYGKLGVENREGLAERARELGLIEDEERARESIYNLPRPVSPLLGRERELEELEALILDGRTRIVSVIGPGGMGKTRLAMELAQRLNGGFADGAAFVPLAPLQGKESIVPAVAQSLRFSFQGGGLDEKRQLLNFLRDKELLLVLDNYEHLIDGAPLLAEIAENAPGLRMVVTSREKLKLRIEQLYPLQSMPQMDWETVEQAGQDPAVRLFLEYGRRVRPNFELKADDLDALHQIMKLVDGMPLAIILASAWLELLTVGEIGAEIQRNIDFLEGDYQDLPGRQRSIRAVFDASWQQLNAAEQKVFSALSVFQGGFSLEAALDVAEASAGVILGLVSRSLVNRGEDGRFDIHELLRTFAAEMLGHSPEYETAVKDSHSGHYLNLLAAWESRLKGTNSEVSIELIKADINNIYAGWNRAVSRERFQMLGTAVFSLTYFTNRTGRFRQTLAAFTLAANRITIFLSRAESPDKAVLAVQVRILAYQCELHHMLGDLKQAETLGVQALTLMDKLKDNNDEFRLEDALVRTRLGLVYSWLDRYDEARTLVTKGLNLFEALGDDWQAGFSNLILGGIYVRMGHLEEAAQHQEKARHIFEALGDRRLSAQSRMLLGFGLPVLGQAEEGKRLLVESISALEEMREHVLVGMAVTFLAETLIREGDFEEGQTEAARGIAENLRLGSDSWINVSRDKWCWASLHLGDYDGVLEHVEAILAYARENEARMRLGRGVTLGGEVWLARQELDKAIENLQEGALVLREIEAIDYLCLTVGSLGCALVKSGDFSEAEKIIPEALNFGISQKTGFYLAATLPALALLKSEKGAVEEAVALYSLACSEPYVANSRWYEDVVGRSIAEAAASLPTEVVEAAQERGRGLDLWETAELLRQEL